jgi:hypothetical protein
MLNPFPHNSVFPLIRHINKVDAFTSVLVGPHIEKLSTHGLPRPAASPGFSRRDAGQSYDSKPSMILQSGYLPC